MSWLKRVVERDRFLKDAETDEHQRLSKQLSLWAGKQGFNVEPAVFRSGVRPDESLFNADKSLLFIGDAKNSATETTSRTETIRELARYMEEFAQLLSSEIIRGGVFAIATNNKPAADDWVPVLNDLARSYCLCGPDDSPPHFQIDTVDPKTHIIFW